MSSDFYLYMSTLETITIIVVIIGAVIYYSGKWVWERVKGRKK